MTTYRAYDFTAYIRGHKYAQCGVIHYTNGDLTLRSYSTDIIHIRNGWLYCTGLYSRTTIKHIGWFMRELGFDYYTAKALYQDNKVMNINTGEILKFNECPEYI